MDKKHEDLLTDNYKKLVDETDLNELLPKIQEFKIFPDYELEILMNANVSTTERKRTLYRDIKKRGPTAFNNLLKALFETGHWKLLEVLDSNYKNVVRDGIGSSCVKKNEDHVDTPLERRHATPFRLPDRERYQNVPSDLLRIAAENQPYLINVSSEPLKVDVKKSSRFYDSLESNVVPPYPMRSKHRGVVLLINNVQFLNDCEKYREGAIVDEQNISELFEQCGLLVKSYRDLTKRDMMNVLKSFVKNDLVELRPYDCCIVCIMSHGNEGAVVEATNVLTADGQSVLTSDLIQLFDATLCPILQKKPKIFLFQTCRGMYPDYGAKHSRTQYDGKSISETKMRSTEDMLIANSTVPGYASHRDVQLGTWYIQAICKIFMEHAHDKDIETMLRLVDVELSGIRSEYGSMQTTSYENRGFRTCYLHPGIYEEDNTIKEF